MILFGQTVGNRDQGQIVLGFPIDPLPLYLSIYLSTYYLSIYLSTYLPIYLSIYLYSE